MINKKNSRWQDRTDKEDAFYPAPKGEQDHKALMSKWNAQITSSQLLNKLVKPNDTVKTKNEIARNLKFLKNNHENFRISNGFKAIQTTLGPENMDILIKDRRIADERYKTNRGSTPVYERNKDFNNSGAHKIIVPYTERKKISDAEWQEKMKSTSNLIEKVTKTRKDIKTHTKARLEEEKKKEETENMKFEQQQKLLEEQRDETKQKKLQMIEERRKKNEEDKERQLQQMKEYQKKFIRYSHPPTCLTLYSKKPRYKEMEDAFDKKVEFTGLEKRKRVLASLRDLHQPLNMERIENEQKKYEEIIREKNQQKKQELIDKMKEQEQTYDYKKFHSTYMDRVIEKQILDKEKQMEDSERRHEYQNKMREYDDTIKKNYKPVTSRKKQEQIEKIKEQLNMNPREKVRRSSPVINSDKDDIKEQALKRKKIFEWKNPMKPPTPPPRKEYEQKNFLKDFQDELKEEFERTGKKLIPYQINWQEDLNTKKLSSTEKYDFVKNKANQLEKLAKDKQLYMDVVGGTIHEKEQVNDLIFDSINAKLSLLQSAVKNQQ